MYTNCDFLQGGHFDLADRMFNSIKEAWLSASKHNMADVKELIPEFFYLPEFLVNTNHFDLGKYLIERYIISISSCVMASRMTFSLQALSKVVFNSAISSFHLGRSRILVNLFVYTDSRWSATMCRSISISGSI